VTSATSNNYTCRGEELAAYLDGELDGAACSRLELHLKECQPCAASLQEQRRLLCALDIALTDEPALALPLNFSQVVAAQAQSDMSGVRHPAERGRALWLGAALAVLSFALLGGAALSETVLTPLKVIGQHAVSIFGLFWQVMHGTGMGLAIILRAIGRHFIFESHTLGRFAILLFACALLLLTYLVIGYHRQQVVREDSA
jgi:hypothetical protein